jgi:hypothetical protein
MNKTDEILDRLKDWQPVIDNPDELTDSIMARLPESETRGSRWRLVAGRALQYVSTIAAVCLIGLFLYQQSPMQKTDEEPHYNKSCFSAGSTLKDVYMRRQQQDNLITYNQLRKMLYEKK